MTIHSGFSSALGRLLVQLLVLIVLPLIARAQDNAEDAFKFARNLYKDAGDFATSAELLGEFIRNFPRNERLAEARLMRARSLKNSGRCDLAITAYEDFYLGHPEHLSTAAARTERATCLSQRHRYVEAAQAFEEVQSRFSASGFAASALLDAAANYSQGGEVEQAARAYRRLVAEYSGDEAAQKARYRLAELAVTRGETAEAQRWLQQIAAADPPVALAPGALLFAGRIHLFLGSLEAAEAVFATLSKRFPASTQRDSAALGRARYLLERRHYSHAGDAFAAAERQVADPRLKKQAALGQADARRLAGNPEVALAQYRTLLESGSSLPPEVLLPAKIGLAIALGETGDVAAAVGLFHDVMESNAGSNAAVESRRELGVLYRRQENFHRSVVWYQRYLEEAGDAPDRDRVRLDLARVFLRLQLHDEAIAIFEELMDSGSAEAHMGLAETLERSGQKKKALREYAAFMERYPDHPLVDSARDRAEYLRRYSVMDAERLERLLQQAWMDELNGTPREIVQLDVATGLFDLHDFPNAVRTYETYVAAYSGSPYAPKAQYFLGESLIQLARQRRLEGLDAAADSLETLALQEFRILGDESQGEWGHRAAIKRLELEAAAAPDSSRYAMLEAGFSRLLGTSRGSAELSLLGLADARRNQHRWSPEKLDQAIVDYRRFIEDFPHSTRRSAALYGLGRAFVEKGNYTAAIDTLQEVLSSDSRSALGAASLYEMGQLLRRQQKLEEAAARYRELLWTFPAFPQRRQAQLNLADIHFDLGEYGLALGLYRQTVRNAGEDGTVWRRIARCHERQGEAGKALAILREVATNEPQAADLDSLSFTIADLLVTLNLPAEAAQQYQLLSRELAHSPLATAAALKAANLHFDMEQYAEAHQLFEPVLQRVEDERVHARAILSLFRAAETDRARKAAKRFRKRFGKQSTWLQLFQLEEAQYLLGTRAYDPALKIFREVAAGGGPWASEGAYFEATTMWEQHHAAPTEESGPKALNAQARFVERFPASPRIYEVHWRLGNYHFGLRGYLLAAAAYKRILDGGAAPDLKAQAVWQLLECYARVYEFDEAHRVALRLLREFPGHARRQQTQLRIGIILMEKGQYAQAIAQLQEVLEWARGNDASEARFYIGESYRNMGEYRKAIEAYYRVSFHGSEGFSQWISSADFKRAECHELLNELATAESVYLRIVQREGSESPQGAIAEKKIEQLRQRAER
jgi:TolA-binding protein